MVMSYIHTYKNFSMVHIVTYVEDVSGLRGWRLWLAAKQILTICMYRFNCTHHSNDEVRILRFAARTRSGACADLMSYTTTKLQIANYTPEQVQSRIYVRTLNNL